MDAVLHEDFLDFIKALNANHVEYMVVGGYAVIFHGYPRTTGDLDVWVNKSEMNYDRLLGALSDFQMPVFDMTRDNFLNNPHFDVFAFGRSPVSIEILNAVKGLDFRKAYANAISKEIDNTPVRFLSRSDLIKAKRAANRPRDINDIENLQGE